MCQAQNQKVFLATGEAPNGIEFPPGTCQHVGNGRLMFTCPGCGQWGSVYCNTPKRANCWEIISGTVDDATTLTLSPSILCVTCCGWHGYLKNGVFEKC